MSPSLKLDEKSSIAIITVLIMVGLLAISVGSAVATTNAGIGLTGAAIVSPIPGDAAVGTYVFVKGAGMVPTGPGGVAIKAGTMA